MKWIRLSAALFLAAALLATTLKTPVYADTDSDQNIEAYSSEIPVIWQAEDEETIASVSLNGIPVSNDTEEAFATGTYFPTETDGASTGKDYELIITPAEGYQITSVTIRCDSEDCAAETGTELALSDLEDGAVSLEVTNEAFAHEEATSYEIVISSTEIPVTLYIEYDYGDIVDRLEAAGADVSAFATDAGWTQAHGGNVYTSADKTTGGGILIEDTRYAYTYAAESEDDPAWQHYTNILTQAAIDAAAEIGYEFAGWSLTYYESCVVSGDRTLEMSGETSTGTVGVGIEIPVTGHIQITALWVEAGENDVTYTGSLTGKGSVPSVSKSILVDGEEVQSISAGSGDTITFQLTSNVPEALEDYLTLTDSDGEEIVIEEQSYRGSYAVTFHDKSGEVYEIDPESVVVTIDGEIVDKAYYDVSTETDDECGIEITIDYVEVYEEASYIEAKDLDESLEVTVSYTAEVSDVAVAGSYDEAAWVSYEDSTSEESTTEVEVYAISVFKYDQEGEQQEDGTLSYTGLANAVFGLYSDESLSDESFLKTLTTDETGYVTFDALAEGTYYLREISPPDGYAALTEAIKITVSAENATNYVVTQSVPNAKIPETGGKGTGRWLFAGCLLAAGAGMILLKRQRRTRATG